MPPLPLSDIRVLALEQFGAGPFGTMYLADLGADVIKVEDPTVGGDVARYVPPYQQGDTSLFNEAFNRGKRSIALDLRHPGGPAVLRDAAANVDVVFCNLRGDQPERLGLTYEQLRDVNPRLVCCSLSGFGMTGPRAAQGSYDYVVQGLAGWMSITGGPDEPPTKSGLSLVDFTAGIAAATAILAGVHAARRDGVGCQCDLSLLEVALSQLNYVGTWVASRGYAPRRLADSAHQSMVPFQLFPTADAWIVVACPKQRLWEQLCGVLEREDLLDDPRFADFAGRDEHRDELLPALKAAFGRRTTTEWLERCAAAGVPAGPVNDVAAALQDPQVAAREVIRDLDHPLLGHVRHIASPLRVGERVRDVEPAPRLGEHTDTVLRDLCGYDGDAIARLRREGILG